MGIGSPIAFELYTSRAARVVVFAAHEAARHDTAEVGNEHTLLGLARDAVTPWPESDETPAARLARLPVEEDTPLAVRVLEELGVSGDALVSEVCRVAGLVAPDTPSDPASWSDTGISVAHTAASQRAVTLEIMFARRRHGNHISTLHQLLAVSRLRGSSGEALTSLGVSTGDIKRASSVVEEECARMRHQMLLLASENEPLHRSLAATLPGSVSGLRWKRRRLQRP